MLFATDLVEYLIRCGVPMRQAHDLISEIVADCRAQGVSLADLSPEQMQKYSLVFQANVLDLLSASKSAASKTSPGGTAPSQVKAALQKARQRLG
jgi:argininosuccinate lyase